MALARDAAFCFYYEENLVALRAAGFEIVEFSPIAGDTLPPIQMLYFGGGYPESFAREPADNINLADGAPASCRAGNADLWRVRWVDLSWAFPDWV